jgi:hypothetical protein
MGSNSDVNNDVLASQQYNNQPTMSKTSQQVNGWPPTK